MFPSVHGLVQSNLRGLLAAGAALVGTITSRDILIRYLSTSNNFPCCLMWPQLSGEYISKIHARTVEIQRRHRCHVTFSCVDRYLICVDSKQ